MRISEVIEALEAIAKQHGDLEVSSGYRDYPEGYANIREIKIEDFTKRDLGGKLFVSMEHDVRNVADL
jgi:hypothetical protein